MGEPILERLLFKDSYENITEEKLKIYFDDLLHEFEVLQKEDFYIQGVDMVVTHLLKINADNFIEATILEHPFFEKIRDLSIELLQENNIVAITLLTLFMKMYSNEKINTLSKLSILFFHSPLLDALVHQRMDERFSSIIDDFLTKILSQYSARYYHCAVFRETGPFLDEVFPFLCSSAYVDTFRHLLTRPVALHVNRLDAVEQFYLLQCPIYVCLSREHECYMHVSTIILDKMLHHYVNILDDYSKIMKDCSEIIIGPVLWLMNLLQCISVSHELYQRFTDINQSLVPVMWVIINKLKLQLKPDTAILLASTMTQMFYVTFQPMLLLQIKKINMIPTLLELLNDSNTAEIQLASCRLLSVVMTEEEIRNQLTNTAQITIVLLADFQNPVFNPFFKIRLGNSLFCLKSNASLLTSSISRSLFRLG